MLYRVFDTMEFENEESNKFETGISGNGNFSESQTKDLMPLISIYN